MYESWNFKFTTFKNTKICGKFLTLVNLMSHFTATIPLAGKPYKPGPTKPVM